MKQSIRKRVAAGTGANAFGQAISTAIQVFSLPLFLYYWDASTYGAWLILSAIPSYLSMADIGMVTAAGNKMTMAMGRQDHAQANMTFQSALLFMLIVCSLLLLLLVPAVIWLPISNLRDSFDYRLAFAALSCGIILACFGGLADAIFRATSRYPLGVMMGNLIRLGEWAGAMAGLALIGSFGAVAVGGLIARALGVLLVGISAARGTHGISWGLQNAALSEARAMLKPAMSFMLFPLAFALSFQGVTLIVGQLLGTGAVAIFNTYRTIARVAVQATSVFSHALGPEFSRLYGVSGPNSVRNLYGKTSKSAAIFAVLLSAFLYLISEWLLQTWTHGAINFDPVLMIIMLSYAAIGGVGHVPRTLLLCTNKHIKLSLCILTCSGTLLILALILGRFWGLIGVGYAMLLTEAAATGVCIWLGHKLLYLSK